MNNEVAHQNLLDASLSMRQCKVVEKVGQCTCFELFDEASNEFLLACAMENSTLGSLIFTTFRDCHLRGFDDILYLMEKNASFVAKMSRDWMTGLTFELFSPLDEIICEIK